MVSLSSITVKNSKEVKKKKHCEVVMIRKYYVHLSQKQHKEAEIKHL